MLGAYVAALKERDPSKLPLARNVRFTENNVELPVSNHGLWGTVSNVWDDALEVADEEGIEVVSPREDAERAGIVSLAPHPEFTSALAAALHNHGVSATVRDGRVRLGAHVSTGDDTIEQFRAALREFGSLATP